MGTQERIGRKRLVVGAHYGTFDFIVQRVTAYYMAIYTVVLFLGYLVTPAGYEGWRALFTFSVGSLPLGQFLATAGFVAVCWHAWVGVRDIWMDYVRHAGARMALYAVTVLWLVGSLVYFLQILWSV